MFPAWKEKVQKADLIANYRAKVTVQQTTVLPNHAPDSADQWPG